MGVSRLRERLEGVAVALLLTAGAALTAGHFYLAAAAAPPRGAVQVAEGSLEAPVQVQLDGHGVPYLSASGLPDLFFAQGYQHAVDRLFQMELLRRTASGRLAEIFGPAALSVDRLVRTLDLWGAAAEGAAALTPGERALVEAYAAGVNARLRTRSGPLPPEFLILGFEPEPWTPRASLAVGKVMALDLSPWSRELDRFHASRVLPPEKFAFVEPRYPGWAPTILPESVSVPSAGAAATPRDASDPEAGPGDADVATGASSAGGARPVAGSAGPEGSWDPVAWLSRMAPFRASNAWAVAGTRTGEGWPLLANDMHLGLQAPPTWYLMSLRGGSTYRVAGFSLPGVPGIVVGMNPDVAWGFTNGVVDDMDFVVERVSDDGREYRHGDGWRPLAVRRETLRVRGREEPVVHRVRSTARGPLITDAVAGVGAHLSVRWVAARPTAEFRGLLGMNRARDADEFDAAIQRFRSPQQNVVYATSDGTIGYRLSGSLPLRPDAGAGWTGYWPPASHPSLRDPEAGYLATANHLQAPGLFGVLGTDYPLPFRARRLVDRLSERGDWDVPSTLALQRDVRSLLAGRLVERAVDAYRRVGQEEAASVLEAWDLDVAPGRRGPALFYLWLYRLRDLVAADEYQEAGEGTGLEPLEASEGEREPASPGGRTYFPDGALLRLLESGDSGNPWIDDVRTEERETLSELEEEAARHASRAVGGRRWGEVHREVHAHPLGRVALLDALVGFNVGPLPGPGGPHTLRPGDRTAWRPMDGDAWTPPVISRHGPSQRFVAEMRPAGRSRGAFLIPTGQSGNPFSSHHRDLLDRWRSGDPVDVPLDAERIAARAVGSYRLVPVEEAETRAR